jgi:tetratricopeptide (TPR) repeat protein
MYNEPSHKASLALPRCVRQVIGLVMPACLWAVVAIGTACQPPLQPPPPEPIPQSPLDRFHRYSDSVLQISLRDSGPQWRVDHFPMLDLHGPYTRPTLPAGEDSNDPVAYYKLGDSVRTRKSGLADRAFYWAIRLDPMMADAYYRRWQVLYEGTTYRLYPDSSVREYRHPRHSDPAAAPVDSLRLLALMYNPFLDVAIDIPPQIENLRERDADRDARVAGLWAYSRGDWKKTVKKLGEAIRKSPDNAPFHVPRAYAWAHLQQNDSAVADLKALIDRIERIEDSIIVPYLSKDMLYYAIGTLRGGEKRYAEARSAYESVLAENLGFYMAHVRLSAVAFFLHDTTAALTELETAAMMRADDPIVLTLHGVYLDNAGRLGDAERQLRAAIHADSDYALPYAALAHVAEERHDTVAAVNNYREYLAHSSRNASERSSVSERIAHLTTSPNGGGIRPEKGA